MDKLAVYLLYAQKIVSALNENMNEFGFAEKIVLKNEYMTIEEDKIILRLPVVVTIIMNKKEFDDAR